ncbi:pentatricopeptide repeat-containing protein At4g21300 [Amborella trichopoda]|uniref:Pentacotripeptide-repeat region of PRORP domain-containing protein n=1 Tax=Amborella trichopoda TaxID=13333 RepID=W1PQF5_AMBTC|nr:pentatricopeptide repeat-containing protein At4g21300 [Amborella trichopoda]ERN10288.1 hypothetical protein AMTR_s00177p00030400 [Amborella trichopoda]|eukprot:XP_006848707.1 pentatricopeptide repeat-containing protein At4g21300 [Amborella trichopoda]
MVFDEMSERDLVAYTAIITGYAEATMTDDSYNSFRILGLMQNEGFSPNRVTLVSLIRAATKIGALFEVKSIHCFALRRGVGHGDEIFETSLIDGYVKCGALEITGAIFSGVGKRNVGSWNVIISGYVQYGNPLRALNFFHFMMIERNLKPDLISLANALLGCADLMCLSLGASIHGYIIRREIDLDLIAATALIEMYGKCRKIEKAKEVFDTVKFKDVVSCNVMIGAYLHSGLTEQAFGVLSLVRETGMRFNTATMLNLLSACANLTDIQRGRQLHGCVVKYGFGSDLEVCNQMVDMYAKCGCLDLARKFLDGMREKDLVSWVSMMMGYVNFGHADKAIAVFQMMQLLRGEKPDSVTIIALLQALSQLGSSRKVKEVHGCVYKLGLERESSIINSLVFTYAKCGKLEASEALFKNMEESDLASWNSMIGAYKSHGNCLKALELLNMMRERRIRPDEVTFTSILSACSHVGLVEEGWKIFYSMIDEYSMTPCEEHYGCMVDLLGRAGHLEEAYSFIRSVPLLQKSTSTLGALLGACRIHGNVKMGEVVASQLLSLEPENSGTYTLLSNIYADAGQWRSAERLRTSARERGLKKIPGYSLTN